jgi:ferritin-like metal-binding protein YciE
MKVKDLESLFVHEVKDLYGAEKQLVKALAKMAKASTDDDLRKAFEDHCIETEKQVQRLDRIFQELGESSRGAKCPAIEGMIQEANELLGEHMEPHVLDTALICAAQRVEHYEIAAYGCTRALAQQLGKDDLAEELQRTLDEEKKANEKLSQIALSHVNQEAMAASQGGRNE